MRRLLGWVAALLVWVVAAELTALVYVYVREGVFVWGRAAPPAPAEPAPEAEAEPEYQAHPYWAFSHRPGKPYATHLDAEGVAGLSEPGGDTSWSRVETNNHGFWSAHDFPFTPEADDAYVIGIFGGSVATLFGLQGATPLLDALAGSPDFAGREVVVLDFGSGGYRQPQQLWILSYFLLLGQKLDLVVNVDGFNEVAIGHMNWRTGIDVAMPSHYHLGGMDLLANLESGPLFLHKVELFRLKQELASLGRRREGARSALVYAFAGLRRDRLRPRLALLRSEPPRASLFRKTLMHPRVSASAEDAMDRAVDLWVAGSVEMMKQARARGARYLHVLQPNQYFGSREFSEAERAVAFAEDSRFREGVRLGYPRLIEAGSRLREAGVEFHDWSALFDRIPEPVYADNCCHFNQTGNDLLAKRLAEVILASGEPRPN